MPKLYFNDIGIRNALLKYYNLPNDRVDKGNVCENYAFIRLRYNYQSDEIHYWRTADGAEVDFILDENQNKKKILILRLKFH